MTGKEAQQKHDLGKLHLLLVANLERHGVSCLNSVFPEPPCRESEQLATSGVIICAFLAVSSFGLGFYSHSVRFLLSFPHK